MAEEEATAEAPPAAEQPEIQVKVDSETAGSGSAAPGSAAPTPSMVANSGSQAPALDYTGSLDSDPIIVKDRNELVEVAKKHMKAQACTEIVDGEPVWRPLRCSPPALGELGTGVRLYFDFIFQMGVLFFVLNIVTVPNMVAYGLGTMIEDNNPLNEGLSKISVANIGHCPENGCVSLQQKYDRCMWQRPTSLADMQDCEKVRDVTPIFGVLDAATVLIFVCFIAFFGRYWIPVIAEDNDALNATPADYTIMIKKCPRVLGKDIDGVKAEMCEEHKNYEAALREHFLTVLKTMKKDPVDDPQAIPEIVLVREYDGQIQNFLTMGKHIVERENHMIHREIARQKGKGHLVDKHQKHIDTYMEKVNKVKDALEHQASLNDENRHVVMAFVTFKTEHYKEKVMSEYRFARYSMFRCCQSRRLRLAGQHVLLLDKACEPNDLYWENLDYNPHLRRIRKIVILILTLIVLILCSLLIVSLKTIGGVASALPPSGTAWVLQPENADGTPSSACFKLCNAEFFTNRGCLNPDDSSHTWNANRWFTPDGDITLTGNWTVTDYLGASCADPILSPACDGVTDAAKNWIGIEFDADRTVQCSRLTQGTNETSVVPVGQLPAGVVDSVRVYACSTAAVTNYQSQDWSPDMCLAMQAIYPSTYIAEGADQAPSGNLKLAMDTSCGLNLPEEERITIDAARESKAEAEALDPDGEQGRLMSDPTYTCFCQQQVAAQGPGFMSPNYDTPSKQLCEPWSTDIAFNYARLVGTILAVLVLNQVLLVVYTFFIQWERLMTVTEVTKSQLLKLLAAQFINTGVLALLVNSKIQSVPDVLQFIKILQIGEGDYYDINDEWFLAVGAGLLITIFAQVVTTTLPPIVIAYIVNPIMIRIFSRTKVTQETLNKVYTLPEWNLALRLAQTLNVFFCVMMYSSGMPILYMIGWIYCLVGYWLDKLALLRGSRRPPMYSEEVIEVCTHMLPVAAFLKACIAVIAMGNQVTFPSDWEDNVLVPIGEAFFLPRGLTKADYDTVISGYINGDQADREDLYWDYISMRFLDMCREGTAVLLIVFLVFCIFYIVTYVYILLLAPFLEPIVFILKEMLFSIKLFRCRCCQGKKKQLEDKDFFAAKEEIQSNGVPFSYRMEANEKYQDAAKAIKAAVQLQADQAAVELAEAVKEAGVAATAEALREEAAATGEAAAPPAGADEAAAPAASEELCNPEDGVQV